MSREGQVDGIHHNHRVSINFGRHVVAFELALEQRGDKQGQAADVWEGLSIEHEIATLFRLVGYGFQRHMRFGVNGHFRHVLQHKGTCCPLRLRERIH